MLNQSKNCNLNYSAQVVELKNKIRHPNADRLIGWSVQGCNVWTSSDYKDGDICIFFPLECQISTELISYLSLFRKSEYNRNKESSSFFELKGRVKALKLRGVPSEGFLLKIESLQDFIKSKLDKDLTYEVGQVFDSFEDFQICKKYVIRHVHASQGIGGQKKKRKALNLVENQFRLHYDTAKLAVHDYMLEPGDVCVITSKWHGCVEANTVINTDIGNKTIKEIVDNKLNCKILALNIKENRKEYVKIDQYYLKPNDGEWYEIELGNGQTIKITGNNPVWLPELQCYRRVDELSENDSLLISNMNP